MKAWFEPRLVAWLLSSQAAMALTLVGCGSETSEPLEQGGSPDPLVSETVTAEPVELDAYGSDPTYVSGTRDEVCRGGEAANRSGRAALSAYIDANWPEVVKVLGYECRELYDPLTPDCDREVEPEVSDCWSTHAAGRAIDVVVGGEPDIPTPQGMALGDEIVSHFLEERDGALHYLARVTGVQEIIWNDRCWHPDDQHVVQASTMDRCGIPGHDNHVHLTLSDDGADGLTSWYDSAEE